MDYCVSLCANAIIEQAAKDYVAAKKRVLRAGPLNCDKRDVATVAECLDFFRGRWFAKLTRLDSEYLIRLLDERAKNEVSKSRVRTKKIIVVEMDP